MREDLLDRHGVVKNHMKAKTVSRQNNFYRLTVQNVMLLQLRLASRRRARGRGSGRTCVVEGDEILRHVHFRGVVSKDEARVIKLRDVQDEVVALLIRVILHRLADILKDRPHHRGLAALEVYLSIFLFTLGLLVPLLLRLLRR